MVLLVGNRCPADSNRFSAIPRRGDITTKPLSALTIVPLKLMVFTFLARHQLEEGYAKQSRILGAKHRLPGPIPTKSEAHVAVNSRAPSRESWRIGHSSAFKSLQQSGRPG